MPTRTASLAALLAALAACETTRTVDGRPESAPTSAEPRPPSETPAAGTTRPADPTPWTERFRTPGLLVADRVEVRGPVGLLEHAVVTQDPTNHSYGVQASPDGLRLECRVHATQAPRPIRAQLDAVAIVAVKELVVLETPGAPEVEVLAAGDVFWSDTGTGEERRTTSLRLAGPISPGAEAVPTDAAADGAPRR